MLLRWTMRPVQARSQGDLAMDTNVLLTIAILVLLAVIAAALLMRRNRSQRLAQRFGPEYDHTVQSTGSRSRAEAELAAREKRREKLEIQPLPGDQAQRFRTEWDGVQARFVDNPRTAVSEADLLVREVMMRRGYPMGDFDARAADLSVDHPLVVEHYRAAHAIALRDAKGEADTEGLRQALVHYRVLFDDLLQPEPAQARRTAADEATPEKVRGGLFSPERAMAKEEASRRERERHKEK
jgi:hypothetical protein